MTRIRISITSVIVVLLLAVSATAQSKEEPKPIAFYSGQVVDADGDAIADATVFTTYSSIVALGEPKQAIAIATSNTDGKFRLPIFRNTSHYVGVYCNGHAIGIKRFSRGRNGIKSSDGNVIQLSKPKTVEVSILGKDGSPAEIDSVDLKFLKHRAGSFAFFAYGDLPLLTRLEDNRLILDWLPQDARADVEVTCKGHVAQSISIDKDSDAKRTAKLQPTAYLDGTVTSEGKPVEPSLIIASVNSEPEDESYCKVYKRLNIRSSEDGSYRIESIEGTASIACYDGRTGSPGKDFTVELAANETTTQNFELAGLVMVTGRVVNKEGNGIEGVEITPGGVITNMNGEYQFEVKPGESFQISAVKIPDGYREPPRNYGRRLPRKAGQPSDPTRVETKVGEKTHEVADLVLPFASPVRGIVVDTAGNPVEGASVRAGWQIRMGRSGTNSGGASLTTDEEGKFLIGNAPNEIVSIYAHIDDMATPKAIAVEKGENREGVRLVLSEDSLMRLRGKIRSTDGMPIKNANITVIQRPGFPWGNTFTDFGATMGECKTSADGSFEFPIPLYRCEYYGCKVSAPGYVGKKVKSLKIPKSGDPTELVDFRLSSLRSIRGVVVDSKGNPLEGARVWSHHFAEPQRIQRKSVDHRTHEGSSASTDADGRFELTGVHDEASFVFAAKDDFRMTGSSIGPGANKIELTLIPNSESTERLKLADLPDEKCHDAIKNLIDFKTKDGKELSHYERIEVLEMLLLVDRERLGQILDKMDWGFGKAQWYAALGHHEEAIETALAYENPQWKIRTLTACAEKTEAPAQRAVLLNEAAFQLANIPNIGTQISMSSSLIDDLLDVGEVETATELAKSIAPAVSALGAGDRTEFTKAWFAKALVRIDYDAAWDLVKDTVNSNVDSMSGGFMRHAGNMAHEIAAEDPDHAIELLRKIQPHQQSRHLPRVACRMASVDPEKALKLLASGKETYPGRITNGRATMAFILKDSHPEVSKDLMREAFEMLFKQFPQSDSRIGLIMNLLRFESHLGEESDNLWKVIEQLSDPNRRNASSSNTNLELLQKSELALLLGIFDREPEIRSSICEELFERFGNPGDDEKIFRRTRENAIAFAAMAVHDPARAVETAQKFEDLTPENRRNGLPKPWIVVAGCLARKGDARIDYMADEFLYTWILGEED